MQGGGGGNFLNELNKGPTYSQLLGNSGGGFGSKLGIFSSLLGSSSGGGVSWRRGGEERIRGEVFPSRRAFRADGVL